MTNWQPIETAPKDGRGILAYYAAPYGHIAIVAFDKNRHHEYRWVGEDGSGAGSDSITHWMPLPNPPA